MGLPSIGNEVVLEFLHKCNISEAAFKSIRVALFPQIELILRLTFSVYSCRILFCVWTINCAFSRASFSSSLFYIF